MAGNWHNPISTCSVTVVRIRSHAIADCLICTTQTQSAISSSAESIEGGPALKLVEAEDQSLPGCVREWALTDTYSPRTLTRAFCKPCHTPIWKCATTIFAVKRFRRTNSI